MSKRILSAVIALPFVLVPLYFGGWLFLLLAWVAIALASYEWVRLLQSQNIRGDTIFLTFSFIALSLALYLQLAPPLYCFLAIILIAALGILKARLSREPLFSISGALLYIHYPFLALVMLRLLPEITHVRLINADMVLMQITFFLLAVVWSVDIFAYFAGKLIGGKKLAPNISPNKTWAGLIGGMVGALAILLIAMLWVTIPLLFILILAPVVAIIEQLGDLFVSKLKRIYGMKDTGALIPGHGGILDRIDGLLAIIFIFFPFLLIYLYWALDIPLASLLKF